MQLWWRNFLNLYLASTTDGLKKRALQSMESFEELGHWVAKEAVSTRYKHQKLSMVCPVLENYARGKSSTKSYFRTTEEKRDRPCKVCNQNTHFGNGMSSKEWNIERSGRWQRNMDCVTVT